jgi:DNA-binding beta-propeller fold protein YncE
VPFRYPDDAFFTPDGHRIIASHEDTHFISLIDYRSRRIVWTYGTPGRAGFGPNQLNTPDDAYMLPDGRVVVADIKNCRVLILDAPPARRIARQFGRPGRCDTSAPPAFLASPNGATPLFNGHLLVTEIGSRAATEMTLDGVVVTHTLLPARYPSDAQVTRRGTIIVADYVNPGRVIEVDRAGRILWEYGPSSGAGRLDHPSLAAELPSGAVMVVDDAHHRVVPVDRATKRIVWQYGRLGTSGRAPGYLRHPDGFDVRAGRLHP